VWIAIAPCFEAVQIDRMTKKAISRKYLQALAQSHILGHRFILPGKDRLSDNDDIRLSHELLEAAVRCYVDAKFDAADVADRLREAANRVQAHTGGEFELTGWKVAAHEKELAFAYLLLEQAIMVRLEGAGNPSAVGAWLLDAVDWLTPDSSLLAWPGG